MKCDASLFLLLDGFLNVRRVGVCVCGPTRISALEIEFEIPFVCPSHKCVLM